AVLGLVVTAGFNSALRSNLDRLSLPAAARATVLAHRQQLAGEGAPHSLPPSSRQQVRAAINDSFITGFRWAMGLCIILSLLSAVASFVLIRPPTQRASAP
ncbi:MAG: hypothetical protein ACRDFS_11505, partial [Chloroflexota bacterium]